MSVFNASPDTESAVNECLEQITQLKLKLRLAEQRNQEAAEETKSGILMPNSCVVAQRGRARFAQRESSGPPRGS